MKKWSVALLGLVAGLYANAQETGMHFEHNTTWAKVLAKAKAEKKYIFVDCFATWCGPCKQMAKNIFPMENVGKFYNANFINVKIQFDTLKDKTTGKILDDAEVQSWFPVATKINADYKIMAYPTYMIFDANGVAVHRAVGSSDAEKFIAKGKEALSPETQYYSLKRQYEAGKHDPAFSYKVAVATIDAYDKKFAKTVSDAFLATQENLYTKENMNLIANTTESTKDLGFKILSENPEKADVILGKGEAYKMVKEIILREEVSPKVFARTAPAVPDWTALENDLKAKYPAQAKEIFLYSKVIYTQRKRDWKNFGSAVSDYMKDYGSDATPEQMNAFAWTVFENCEDAACVASAMEWSKKSFADNNNHQFMDTYANLLYKSGKKQEAIEWETKALDLAKKNNEDTGDYQETLNKMTKGEKTW